jgi:hypothetical protein
MFIRHLIFNQCLGVCFCVVVYVFSNRSFKKQDACPCKQHTFVVYWFLPHNLRQFSFIADLPSLVSTGRYCLLNCSSSNDLFALDTFFTMNLC